MLTINQIKQALRLNAELLKTETAQNRTYELLSHRAILKDTLIEALELELLQYKVEAYKQLTKVV